MKIERKTLVGRIDRKSADDMEFGPHGGFDGILSHPDEDRDGETILAKDWEALPETIPLNADHNMSLDGQIGSATPYIKDGALRIKARFTSQPDAQRVRELINDGHVSTLSVEFLRKSSRSKDATGAEVETVTRELLGGAVTAYPSNTSAKILASKAGARNSKADLTSLQEIHDHTTKLGATCTSEGEKSVTPDTVFQIDGKSYVLQLKADKPEDEDEDTNDEATEADSDSDASATADADDDDDEDEAAKSIAIRAKALELQAQYAQNIN